MRPLQVARLAPGQEDLLRRAGGDGLPERAAPEEERVRRRPRREAVLRDLAEERNSLNLKGVL